MALSTPSACQGECSGIFYDVLPRSSGNNVQAPLDDVDCLVLPSGRILDTNVEVRHVKLHSRHLFIPCTPILVLLLCELGMLSHDIS